MKKQILKKRKAIIGGTEVTIKTIKPKNNKVSKYVTRSNTTCPNCQSLLQLNNFGQWECTGNKLKVWEKEFILFRNANDIQKSDILTNFSNSSRFLELFDRWSYSQDNLEDSFDCGYSNEIFPLISESKETIPDPLVVKKIEKKLGRKLTFEELLGETELYFYQGKILTEWRKRAKLVKIPWIILPSEMEIRV